MGPAPTGTDVEWTADGVVLRAADSLTVAVDRAALTSTITAPRPVPDAEVVHPLLAFVGAAVARWTGRSAFHGAAVVLHGRAWVLLAHPGGGKSTLASALNHRGHAVLSDDLAVVDDHTVLAGPRSCDLREESAEHLGRGAPISASTRQRWREELVAAPHEVPLGGFVSLGWGDGTACTRGGAGEKLALLATHEALGEGPTAAESFLDLLDVPLLVITRPKTWAALTPTLDLLEAASSG